MGGRPELQQGKVDPSFLKHPILAPMATRRRSNILEMELRVRARWASERSRWRRGSHTSVEAPETLAMVRA